TPGATPGAWKWRASTMPLTIVSSPPPLPACSHLEHKHRPVFAPRFCGRSPIAIVRQLGRKWLLPPYEDTKRKRTNDVTSQAIE
ncbi:hypothetical protein K525DRAFT_254531, partial [Schizophyllum commune Loenen D]